MIKSIKLNNFKPIKDKTFHLSNLNVLLGMNGQGKSSFIQSLLLLRQSYDKLNKGMLELNGPLVKIGVAKDALYQYAKSDLAIGLTVSSNDTLEMAFNYEADSDVLLIKNFDKVKSNSFFANTHNEGLFSNAFQYLHAHRIEPKTLHSKSLSTVSIDNSLGTKGEYTVHYLETKGSQHIAFKNCIHPNTAISFNHQNEKFQDQRLIQQVNLWLSEISPDVNIKINSLSSDFVQLEYEFHQPTFGKTMPYKPENVGFGISYALHVVTALLAARAGSLVIIESPESHIHPRGQAQLGKLIALVAQNDVQIIIETHSDHILNGIRVAVKEGLISKDKTTLFYFKKNVANQEQFSAITDIKIDRNGTLSDEPDGLLDEWGNQLLKLI